MEVQWEKMFVDQLEKRFEEYPVAYFPYGLCEPHGPQCVLGTDGLRSHGLLCHAAKANGGIVAPSSYWHIGECGGEAAWAHKAIGQVERTWFTTIPPWVFYRNFCYHIRMVDSLGFHGAIFHTAHEGTFITDMKRIINIMQPYVGTRLMVTGASELNTYKFNGGSSGHAGRIETSELMVYNPESVDITRIGKITTPGNKFAMGADAHEANKLVGEKMIASQVVSLGLRSNELLDDFKSLKPQHKLKTFGQVEEIWENQIKPVLPKFEMMQDLFEGWDQEPVPEDSCWYENWKIPELWS